MPLTFLSIIASRPVGTMFHFTCSAWIQYSRRVPRGAGEHGLRRGARVAAWPRAAATFGGTGISLLSLATSACCGREDLLARERAEEEAARRRRESSPAIEGSGHTASPPRYFLTLTFIFITDLWIRADEVVGARHLELLLECCAHGVVAGR